MAQLVEARCPGCRTSVRLPGEWVGKAVRCKHCRATLRVRPKSKSTRAFEATQPVPVAVAVDDEPMMALAAEDEILALSVEDDTPVAAIVDEGDPFAYLDGNVAPMVRQRPPRKRSMVPLLVAGLLFVVLAGVAGLFAAKSLLHTEPTPTDVVNQEPEPTPPDTKPAEPPKYAGIYPRRLLAVSINNYLFANPVSFGVEVKDFGDFTKDVASTLKIPNDQVVLVTDSAAKGKAKPPMKGVLEHTIGDFLDTSRAQDRVVLLMCCHAVEIDKVPYLVPFEGDVSAKESLIPLKWLMDKLGQCKARQKILIADFCPTDRSRGEERPGSGPMGAEFDKALGNPPEGVQVWTSCTAGQQSQEGIFLDEIYQGVRKNKSRKPVDFGEQKPELPIPIDNLVAEVARRTEFQMKRLYPDLKQTPRLAGKEKEGGAEYDPYVPPAKRVEVANPALAGGVAPAEFVRAMLAQVDTPPTKKIGAGMQPLTPETLPWFAGKITDEYPDEPDETPLRKSVVKAIKALRTNRPDDSFREEFKATNDMTRAKKDIENEQKKAAAVQIKLADVLLEMEQAAEGMNAEKSKRWRALYQFVLAKLKQRIAYLIEYNYILGMIRGDALPPRDAEAHSGWRLASREKLQCAGAASSEGKDARKYAKEAKDLFQTIVKENAGTPYEVLAKRESTTALGLEWQPMR